MKILLDFDDTIFDTKAFKKHIFEVLKKNTVFNGEVLYEEGKKRGELFSLFLFLKKLNKENLYKEIMEYSKECVHKEISVLLSDYGKENCFIITYGDKNFQKEKIDYSGVMTMVQEVTVVSGSKKNTVEAYAKRFPYEKVLFIDDKKEFLDDVDTVKYKNLTCIHFADMSVKDLKQVISSVEKVV